MNSNCPCPLECERHGDCVACRKFHELLGEHVYCEKELLGKVQAGPSMGVNLMDYAACAG
jgi:hypothetical protein